MQSLFPLCFPFVPFLRSCKSANSRAGTLILMGRSAYLRATSKEISLSFCRRLSQVVGFKLGLKHDWERFT